MDVSRYEKLRTTVRENFSEHTQQLVDEALTYAAEKLDGLRRYDGTPLLDPGVAVASIVLSEVGLGRNSTLSSILHDDVPIAHTHPTPQESAALTAHLRDHVA